MEDERTDEEFEHDLIRLLHTTRNGWRREEQMPTAELEAIRSSSHKSYRMYSKQIQVIKRILTPLLRAHAWHWIRYSEADERIAERTKLTQVKVKKGGGRRKKYSDMSAEELVKLLTPEQLKALADKVQDE